VHHPQCQKGTYQTDDDDTSMILYLLKRNKHYPCSCATSSITAMKKSQYDIILLLNSRQDGC